MRITLLRHNRIRTGKAGDTRDVIPRIVVDEAEVVVVFLAGEAAVGVGLARGGAVGTEGEVAGAAAVDYVSTVVEAHDAVAA